MGTVHFPQAPWHYTQQLFPMSKAPFQSCSAFWKIPLPYFSSPACTVYPSHHPASRFPTVGAGSRLCSQPATEDTEGLSGRRNPVCWHGQSLHACLLLASQGHCRHFLCVEERQSKRVCKFEGKSKSNGHAVPVELKRWERNTAAASQGLTPIFRQILIQF